MVRQYIFDGDGGNGLIANGVGTLRLRTRGA